MTILNIMKVAENSFKMQKTLWKKNILLITSNLSFSHSVYKRLVDILQTHKNKGLFGKGLREALIFCFVITYYIF